MSDSPAALPSPGPSVAVRRSRTLALVSCAALLLLGLAWELVLAPTGRGTLALKVLPLALALPGLWRLRLYTYRWLSLVVWLYVTEAAVRINTPGGRGVELAAAQGLLAVVLFAACAWQVRSRLAAGAALGKTAETPVSL